MTARRGLVLQVVGAAVVGVFAALPWFRAPVAALGLSEVTVAGGQAAPALTAMLLVAAASLVAWAMARGVARRVIAWLGAAVWLGVGAAIVAALADPERALRAAAAEATGVAELAGSAVAVGFPAGALIGVALGLAGAVLLAFSRATARPSRYERPAQRPAATPAPVSDWDALSRGDDPTAEADQVG